MRKSSGLINRFLKYQIVKGRKDGESLEILLNIIPGHFPALGRQNSRKRKNLNSKSDWWENV